jgi:hypothetical protein
VNAWLRPDPALLGPKEDGIPKALAQAAKE